MELIDLNELLKQIGQDAESDGNERAAQILECILNAPKVDAVRCAYGCRCGECVYWVDCDGGKGGLSTCQSLLK